MQSPSWVTINDTTLRDGEQSAGGVFAERKIEHCPPVGRHRCARAGNRHPGDGRGESATASARWRRWSAGAADGWSRMHADDIDACADLARI